MLSLFLLCNWCAQQDSVTDIFLLKNSALLTGAVHLLALLFRSAHKIAQKVLRRSRYSRLTHLAPS